MKNWKQFTFENAPIEIIDGDRGVNYPKQTDFTPFGHCLFLNVGNVTEIGFDFSNLSFIDEEKDNKLRKGKLSRQDIVLTTRGTVGNLAFYNENVYYDHVRINSGMVIFRVDPEKIFPRFFYFQLKSNIFDEQVKAYATGSAQPQLPIRDIKRFEFSLPPLPEQRAIAGILGALDDKIELNRRMNCTLEAMARTVFLEWFVENEDYIGWEVSKLVDFIGINERSVTKEYSKDEIEYIDISSVSNGYLASTTPYTLKDAPSRARRLVQHGDTIWSTVRPNRKSYLFINNPKDNLVVSTGFVVLTPKKIPPSFLYFFTTTEQFVDYLVSNADGSAYPAVLPERFADAEFPLPPDDLVDKFEVFSNPILAQIAYNENESHTLASLRDSLLPKLMSGEVRVSEL